MAEFESFERGEALEIRSTRLPAEHYNLAHRLLVGSGADCLFVPIRSIQYLAVIDAEEIIFVDRDVQGWVALAWRHFRPQARNGLAEPVPYELHLYRDAARSVLPQLQTDFFKSLKQLDQRQAAGKAVDAQLLPFPSRHK